MDRLKRGILGNDRGNGIDITMIAQSLIVGMAVLGLLAMIVGQTPATHDTSQSVAMSAAGAVRPDR